MGEMDIDVLLRRCGRRVVVVGKDDLIVHEVEKDDEGVNIFLREDVGQDRQLAKVLFCRVINLKLLTCGILLESQLSLKDDREDMRNHVEWAANQLNRCDFGIRDLFEKTYRFKFDSLVPGWFMHPRHMS